MREIKFRAWHKADEQMYEVYGFSQNQWFLRGKRFPMPPGAIKIMQYTGLKDKNGKEIYEGDICETVSVDGQPFGTVDVVKFNGGAFELTDIADSLLPVRINDSDIYSIEVIGNIYENPEILEVNL